MADVHYHWDRIRWSFPGLRVVARKSCGRNRCMLMKPPCEMGKTLFSGVRVSFGWTPPHPCQDSSSNRMAFPTILSSLLQGSACLFLWGTNISRRHPVPTEFLFWLSLNVKRHWLPSQSLWLDGGKPQRFGNSESSPVLPTSQSSQPLTTEQYLSDRWCLKVKTRTKPGDMMYIIIIILFYCCWFFKTGFFV